jgi:hypothetical protein
LQIVWGTVRLRRLDLADGPWQIIDGSLYTLDHAIWPTRPHLALQDEQSRRDRDFQHGHSFTGIFKRGQYSDSLIRYAYLFVVGRMHHRSELDGAGAAVPPLLLAFHVALSGRSLPRALRLIGERFFTGNRSP